MRVFSLSFYLKVFHCPRVPPAVGPVSVLAVRHTLAAVGEHTRRRSYGKIKKKNRRRRRRVIIRRGAKTRRGRTDGRDGTRVFACFYVEEELLYSIGWTFWTLTPLTSAYNSNDFPRMPSLLRVYAVEFLGNYFLFYELNEKRDST